MQIIGVTGGIGSGKTTVCKLFKTLGIPIYDADEAAKRLMTTNKKVIQSIKNLLGENAYEDEGQLNKAYIAQEIFPDKEKLKKLNEIVHPATIEDSVEWSKKQKAPYVLKESALLFETRAFHFVDKAIGVYAPKALRIKRVMQRNKISREEVIERMENQLDEEIKMRLCDFVILNDEQHPLITQVLDLHKKLLENI